MDAVKRVSSKGLDVEPVASPVNGAAIKLPKISTRWQKSVPAILVLIGSFVGSIGTWYSSNVPQVDPDLDQQISAVVNVPAVCSAVVGIITIIVGLFAQGGLNSKAETTVAQLHSTATVAVAQALASPPVNGDGKASVSHTLNCALTQASQERKYSQAESILKLIKELEGVQ